MVLAPSELDTLPWMVPVSPSDLEEAGAVEEDGEPGEAGEEWVVDAEDDTVDETVMKKKRRFASQLRKASTPRVRAKPRPEKEKRPTRNVLRAVVVVGDIMAMEEVARMGLEHEADGAITAAMVMDHTDAEVLLNLTLHKVEWVHSIWDPSSRLSRIIPSASTHGLKPSATLFSKLKLKLKLVPALNNQARRSSLMKPTAKPSSLPSISSLPRDHIFST